MDENLETRINHFLATYEDRLQELVFAEKTARILGFDTEALTISHEIDIIELFIVRLKDLKYIDEQINRRTHG